MEAYLILRDETAFTGTSIGSQREVISEIVFSISMTDYLGVLTDPSYVGQAATMIYPLIGNYGICHEDIRSAEPWPDDYTIKELSRTPNNFRSEDAIQNFLKEHNIPGISGIGTRTLTKILRGEGTINSVITVREYTDLSEPIEHMEKYSVTGVVLRTSTKRKYMPPGHSEAPGGNFPGAGEKVALMDYGAKKNIARSLSSLGCEVIVYPADILAEEVLAACLDGIMLSNGPGNSRENTAIIEEIEKPYASDALIFAICLGHQLMALANGMDICKLKYGYRGGNHPTEDLETGRIYVSSQNHGYVVDMEKVNLEVAVPTFVNVSGGTSEGLKYVDENIFTAQYHPETCPGLLDSGYLFNRSLKMIEVKN